MTWKNEYVRFQKMGSVSDPEAPTIDWLGYKEGEEHPGYSIPIDYWVEGYLRTEPSPGNSIIIERKIRNGIEINGVLQTSSVSLITPIAQGSLRVETKNSVYILSKKMKDIVP